MSTIPAPLTFDQDSIHDGICILCADMKTVCKIKITSTGKTTTACATCGVYLLDLLSP